MANYSKITDYAAKDNLLTGDPAKLVRGSEIGADFDAVSTAVATKADAASPTITGSPTAAGATWTSLGTVTTVDINGGTIDGVTIGAAAAPTVTNIDINGGTIDGATIGGTTPGAGTFTTVTTTGNIELGNASDTTLSRVSAGVVAVEGSNVLLASGLGSVTQAYNTTLAGIAAGTTALGGFKNKIIGGDFTTNPWQRGTSFTNLADEAYGCDRFRVGEKITTAAVDWLKTADAPTATEAGLFTQHCLHLDVTTADASIAATDRYTVLHSVEGLSAASFGFGQAGTRYVTLSFWHKHTKTGVYCVSILNSAVNRSYVAEYTQDVMDTWEKATVTIAVDTSGTWLYDTGRGVRVSFVLAAGATYQTTANTWAAGYFLATANQVNALDNVANNFKIALVQLEAGEVATAFEPRDVGTELALCQRYYTRLSNASGAEYGTGYNINTTTQACVIKLPTRMRSAITAIEQTGTAADYSVLHGSTNTACSSVPTFATGGEYSVRVTLTVAAGLTAGDGSVGRSNSATSYLGFSAEL